MNCWVYIQSEFARTDGVNLWTVGFYGPDDKWNPDSDWNSPEDAAKRVNYLNGANDELHQAVQDFLTADNEYYDKADGYRNGGASISEWDAANKVRTEAVTKLFNLTRKK